MAIIDRVKYDGPPNVLVWRHPPDDLSWGTQVIVNQTQEALFLKGGEILDLLGPGTHTLRTANIPLLRTLIKIPFGGETPFAAEIYYVNRAVHMDVKWGTPTPIPLLDPVYQVPLPVRAHGQFAIRVVDSRKVFTQLSATASEFTLDAFSNLFRGVLLTRAKDYIAETMLRGKISLLEVAAHLEELSSALEKKLALDFGQYGVELVNFFVHSIDVPEDDDSARRLKKALAQKAELQILGEGYKAVRAFEALEKAAENESGGAVAGVGLGVGLGAGVGVGGMMASALGQAAGEKSAPGIVCVSCRAESPAGSRFCVQCGKGLAGHKCAKCQAELFPGSKFCPGCGEKVP